ncbi:MAG: hypothetical protein VXW63_00810 [Chloroflexota bacterium]|nr:hypothetical protein [Chloroflexota bacterium]
MLYILIFITFILFLIYFLNIDNTERAKSSLPDYGEGYSDHGY